MIFNRYCTGPRITWRFFFLAVIMSLLVSGITLLFVFLSIARARQQNQLSYSKAEPVQQGTNSSISFPFGKTSKTGALNNSSPFTCPKSHFTCNSSRTCLKLKKRCDGHVDCPKAEDELNCVCAFRMSPAKYCDKYPDCFDESDESFCSYCPEGYFNCGDGKCIPRNKVCDSSVDCDNFMDENFCFR